MVLLMPRPLLPLYQAARARGMAVVSTPPEGGRVHYYGGPRYADRLALDLALLEPPDAWLPSLPWELTRRRIEAMTLGEARSLEGPVFVKPPSDKGFPARVYRGDLPGLPHDTAVLVSEVVEFAVEYRLHVLDGELHTGSRYATWGLLDPAPLGAEAGRLREFVRALPSLPSAVVVDVGLIGPPDDPRADLVVVEANMAWFSQPYLGDPGRVLDVVLRAAGPRDEVSAGDRRFVRQCRCAS
ncbi:hypothetical protein Lesp02_59570 [Lentzea sp. NBRC 105346]|uniref:ATP-grasp domain-containing protein n=1 Tax=Lentzea sp. NBRC 105346 TaxID=3032205 RepID=UPI0024A34ECA|nr:ATP-grasp domain-containing protein [Lentzea sp. NBRC 105346]GLZ33769.1 hypothetical protein Lesp02_59570 [Lentzea sp. NBRC 105346]